MKIQSNEEVFNDIYKYYKWGYGSGWGSVGFLNKPFVSFINNFLNKHEDIKIIVDIGCGDWQMGRHFKLGNKRYIGCDVSSVAINAVRKKYSSENRQFLILDAVKDDLPDGDLVIIKDVLQHLSNNDVGRVLSKLMKYKYVIVQNDVLSKKFINRDIKNGSWRPIDVTKPPFNYSDIILVEKYTEGLYKLPNLIRKRLSLPLVEKGIYRNRE